MAPHRFVITVTIGLTDVTNAVAIVSSKYCITGITSCVSVKCREALAGSDNS